MKVFISWSGEKSREVAVVLRDWLPAVINSVQPFVSSKDIHAGTRWQAEIAEQLDATNFGVVCVTRENQAAPWLNFEAGALAKAVVTSRVVPLAVDLKPSDIANPLGQFQAQPATQHGISELLSSINAACDSPLSDALLKRAIEKWWPDLDAALRRIEDESSTTPDASAPERTDRELLEELLDTTRSLARRLPAAGPARPAGPLPEDHPLLVELEALLRPLDQKARILRAGGRRVGIRGVNRPAGLREDIRAMADPYGVRVDFLDEIFSRRSREHETGATSETR